MLKEKRLGFLSILVFGVVMTGGAYSSSSGFHSAAGSIDVVPEVGPIPERIELPQGWGNDIRKKFWFTSQGSRIVPYRWFTWLEQPNSSELFRDAKHMEMLRYLPVSSSPENPAGLPIGFVAATDKKTKQPWVGMTCAACHTNQLDYKGKKFLIEGAPTLANFVLFYSRLVEALNETNLDDAKFERFAKKVLTQSYSKPSARKLRQQLASVALGAAQRLTVNDLPAPFPKDFTSYARLDAFGNIQNAGTAFALHDLANKNVPNGPVSYPFLWGTHQSDVVQWNASAPNTPVVGPLARNVGEVVGVFGNLSMQKASWWKRVLGIKVSYTSNVDIEGLGRLESWVKTLRSPEWPSQFLPPIDAVKAGSGAELFAGECASCHQVIPRSKEGDKYTACKTPVDIIGTDPVTAENASRRMAKTLILDGTHKEILVGDKFGPEAAAIEIPVNGSLGIILKHPKESLEAGLRPIRTHSSAPRGSAILQTAEVDEDALDSHVESHKTSVENYVSEYFRVRDALKHAPSDAAAGTARGGEVDLCGNPNKELVYKARPLNAIWATAPYLHNGSVPNLWELLKKGEDRSDSFWVGSREFDPVNVGYVTSEGLNEFKVKDAQGQVMPGNSNQGHEYGSEWTDEQKWAVIEYMKTL